MARRSAKIASKKTASKKTASKKKAVRGMTQSAIVKELAEANEMAKGDVKYFLETLQEMLVRELNIRSKKAPGKMVIPGICRIIARRKPATKARKGINPFTKEPCTFKAKPATTVVKITPVKAFKQTIAG